MRRGFRHRASLPGMRRAPTRPRRCTSATTASGRSRWPTTTRRIARHRSAGSGSRPGPATIWRYARPAAGVRRRRRSTSAPGFTPLVRADRLAAELGLGELWIKNDTANPTGLVQGPGGVGGADQGPPARVQGGRLRLDRQPGQLGGRPRRPGRHGVGRAHPRTTSRRPRSPRPRSTAGTWCRRRGHLRRRQPAVRRADQRAARPGPSSTSTSAPTTPRGRRPWPSRSPSSSAGRPPTTWSCRSARAAS